MQISFTNVFHWAVYQPLGKAKLNALSYCSPRLMLVQKSISWLRKQCLHNRKLNLSSKSYTTWHSSAQGMRRQGSASTFLLLLLLLLFKMKYLQTLLPLHTMITNRATNSCENIENSACAQEGTVKSKVNSLTCNDHSTKLKGKGWKQSYTF